MEQVHPGICETGLLVEYMFVHFFLTDNASTYHENFSSTIFVSNQGLSQFQPKS